MDLDLLFSSLVAGLHGRKITQQRMVYEPLRDAILEALFLITFQTATAPRENAPFAAHPITTPEYPSNFIQPACPIH
jgi:hypothetical protein